MELIQSFLEEAPSLLKTLELARQTADSGGARRAAHSLKSNCRDFGALHASVLLAQIETLAASGAMPPDEDIAAARMEVEIALKGLEDVLSDGTL